MLGTERWANTVALGKVTMDQDTAWKLVTKRRSRYEIRQRFPGIRITGDEELGLHVLDMVSVMAYRNGHAKRVPAWW